METAVSAARDARTAAHVHDRLGRLAEPRIRRRLIALAFGLLAPGACSGFALDDYWLLDELSQPQRVSYAGRAPFDLFRWIDDSNIARLTDGGGLGWWTSADTRAMFIRPLASFTHALDHWLWPTSALAMHVHGYLWLGLLFALTLLAYRGLIADRWTFGLASSMFLLDSAHAEPATWIASRSAVLSASFAVGCLACHHRSRSASEQRLGWAALALLAFAASLLGAELGFGIAGYLVAYALCFEAPGQRGRWLALAPYAVVLLAYGALRAHLGYGTFHAFGVYIDPVREPLRFLRVLPLRASLLLSSQLTRFAADLYEATTVWRPQLALISLGLLALGLWFIAPALRAERRSRFFFVGALLATLPAACTLPSDRLLLLIGFGMPPVLAEAIRRTLLRPEGRVRLRIAGVFLLLHLALDPLLIAPYALLTRALGRTDEAVARQLSLPAGDRRTVIVANIPDSSLLYYAQSIRVFLGLPKPERLYWLASAEHARCERLGPRRLRVSHPGGFWDPAFEERSPELPFAPGDHVALGALTAEIVQVTPDGRPAVVDFEFREPLESPSYAWFSWQGGQLRPFAPPP